jgi:hypothetical protein
VASPFEGSEEREALGFDGASAWSAIGAVQRAAPRGDRELYKRTGDETRPVNELDGL